jgi:hypothetical protein
VDSFKLSYPLLSDFPELKAIDKEGIIRGKWHGEPYDIFPIEPILEAARELAGKR